MRIEGERIVIIQTIVDYSTQMISQGGYIYGLLIVLLESYLPFLPLCLFVALNVNAFGFIPGCLISWLGTCIGSYTCYLLFLNIDNKKIIKINAIQKIYNSIEKNISFTKLVLLLTLPFTPSYLINILSGILKISKNKYLYSIIIGKSFTVLFWGYVGNNVIKSITDLKSLTYIGITLILAYIISKIISHKLNIK